MAIVFFIFKYVGGEQLNIKISQQKSISDKQK